MSWALIALLAAAIGGAATVANKFVFVRVSTEPVVQVITGGIVGVILSTIVTSIHGHGSLNGTRALIAIIAGVCFGLSLMAMMYALKIGDVSRVGPLRLLTPVFVAILAALFLGETLSIHVYLGIVLILIGAALIEAPKTLEVKLNSVFGLALMSSLMLAGMQVLTKYLLRFSDPYTVMLYVRFGLLLFVIPILIKNFKPMINAIKPRPLYNIGVLALPATLGPAGMFMMMFAADEGPVTIVSTLAMTAPFFILIYVSFLSRILPDVYAERVKNINLPLRAMFVTVMFAGVILTL
jgi:transporter family protein